MKSLSTFRQSYASAVDYYLAIDQNLARRFNDAVDRAKTEIIRFPKMGKLCKGYRAVMLKGFPYSFCYRENLDGELVALLLFHHKQDKPKI